LIYGEDNFKFKAADFYPFKDQAEIDRVRAITYEDIIAMNGKHPTSPNMTVEVFKDSEFDMIEIADMVTRIRESDIYDKPCIMIMPNPNPAYRQVAYWLHQLKVNCRNVKFYLMDEWADEDGNVAPLTYKAGFGNAFYRFMVSNILDLGFKEENFIYHSNKITPDYSKMLEQDGDADVCYSGPGWPGHLAFIDPVEDWYKPTMEEYLEQEAKVAALHPLTIAQNSLHGSFGCSGDISKVPPKGAMMGPRDAMRAKMVIDDHALTTAGTPVSWQRLTSRLTIFGKPCQEVPTSILQLRDKPTRIIMSDSAAATIKPDYFFQY
jgi:glucosamine-6-phosphate deaminase